MNILMSGMMAADPHQGGATWAVLQYLLGFKALGHEVYFVEPVQDTSLQPQGVPLEGSVNAQYFREVMESFGLEGSAALLRAGTRETVGLSYAELVDIARRSDVLFNISGMLTLEDEMESIPVRVYLDLDPAFIQLWHTQGVDMRFDGHTHFVTIAQAIGRPECSVPTCGLEWISTLQPVVLGHWPVAKRIVSDALTTVGNWRSYGSIEHKGVFYGQKAHSLRPLFTLPTRTEAEFLLAMSLQPEERDDLAALEENGWQLIDPRQVAGTPNDYQQFIQGSWAEFGIAKSGYVASRCGWFSDRTVCYLASGRPAVAQETGFSDYLPTGEGLFAFRTADHVLVGIDALKRDYDRHARAARAIAETYFESSKVLSRLLRCVGMTP